MIRMVIISGWLIVWPPPVEKLMTWLPAAAMPVIDSPPWPGVSMIQRPDSGPIRSAAALSSVSRTS